MWPFAQAAIEHVLKTQSRNDLASGTLDTMVG